MNGKTAIVTFFLAASAALAADNNHCEYVQHLRLDLDAYNARTLLDRLDSIGSLVGVTSGTGAAVVGLPVVKAALVDPSGITAIIVGAIGGTSVYLSKHYAGEIRRSIGDRGMEIDLERVHGIALTSVGNLVGNAVGQTLGGTGQTEQDACGNLLLKMIGKYDTHELPHIAVSGRSPMPDAVKDQLRSFLLTGELWSVNFIPSGVIR